MSTARLSVPRHDAPDLPARELFRAAVRYAGLASSSHDPRRWVLPTGEHDVLELYADRGVPSVRDPAGRTSTISGGAALFRVCVALRAAEHAARAGTAPSARPPGHARSAR